MKFASVLLLLTFTQQAIAEPVKLTGPEISAVLSEQVLTAQDGQVEQIFRSSGLTVYIERGNPSNGSWFVRGDQYCSKWPPSDATACYDVTRDNDIVTFISSSGKTYPMLLKQSGE
jgi:hypothetical protein